MTTQQAGTCGVCAVEGALLLLVPGEPLAVCAPCFLRRYPLEARQLAGWLHLRIPQRAKGRAGGMSEGEAARHLPADYARLNADPDALRAWALKERDRRARERGEAGHSEPRAEPVSPYSADFSEAMGC